MFDCCIWISDDKSCALVGTAEYVSPEVLNGQPITIGYKFVIYFHHSTYIKYASNLVLFLFFVMYRVDLWALGCIIYQMLVGRPPFKCATEYLTFQKVMKRDFTFPDYLSPEAKDLIDRLLVSDWDLCIFKIS